MRENPHPESDALLVRAREGDVEALSLLFDIYSRLVYSIGFSVLHRNAEAEDLVQEVFLYLWDKENKISVNDQGAHRFIIKLAYHRAFDRVRYLKTRVSYGWRNDGSSPTPAVGTEIESNEYRIHRLLEPATNAGEKFYWRKKFDTVFKLLTPKQRRAIEGVAFEGLTLRDVGDITGEGFVTARNHYYRGLAKLREKLLS